MVKSLFEASFTVDYDRVSILKPVVNFTNTSTQASSYRWVFGDGKESDLNSLSHEFSANKAKYNVILIVSNNNGCSDTTIQQIEIYDELTLLFIISIFAYRKFR